MVDWKRKADSDQSDKEPTMGSFDLTRNDYTRTYTSIPAMTKADLIAGFALDALDRTGFGSDDCPCEFGQSTGNRHGHCSGCGHIMLTEGDFARHYLIPDAQYKNLGNCPKSDKTGMTINIPSNLIY